ncbi:type II toxin-antitoxin system MqsR family toxin, partial [Escherichia coli]|uniref:type II toxin-antitoxin system MqsR family toxin n=1 Tax=Escherichia coli TaxID=562 RepID=UPI001F30A846
MEKRTPHTRLSQVKKLVNAGQVRTTRSALLNADELGLDFDGMCNVGNDSNLLIVFYVQ